MADEKEKQAFYKTNAKILKLDTIKDQDLILFNHHIEKEENLQRLSGELQKGLFKFSYPKAEIDLGFSRWKLQKIVKYFEENKIIECIEKSTKKGVPSIYAYTSVYYGVDNNNYNNDYNNNCNNNCNNNLSSISNGLEGVDNNNYNNNYNNDFNNDYNKLKKELLKRDIKNNNMSDSKESDHSPGAFKGDNNNSNKTTKSSKTKRATKVFEENSIEYQLSKKLYQYVLEVKPKTRKPDLQKWSKDFDLILRKDERKVEEVETLIDWIFNGTSKDAEFWRGNIASPGALRGTLKNGADKYADIYSKMEKDTNYYRPLQKELEKELPPITAEEFYDI